LLIVNTAIWLLLDVFLRSYVITLNEVPIFVRLENLLALQPLDGRFWPWQPLTYMFLHAGFIHLFFNMLALWMFGMELENTWGSRKFLIYYLVCGVGAAIANLLIAPLIGQGAPTVGASGAVFGVLIAFGMMFPDRPIYLYFLLPIRAKYFIAVYIGLELFYGVTGTSEGVAHFAHLGGAAVGFMYVLADMDLVPVRRWWSQVRGEARKSLGGSDRFIRKDGGTYDVHDAKFYDIKSGRPMDDDQEINQEMIDAILDKISRGGYQSLTEDEKRILNEASKKIH
jgi:membrane associated rhomboid family serine protease